MPKPILITGPESTGKSTLTSYLSAKFDFGFVNEFARTYLEDGSGQYDQDDILSIAKGHYLIVNQLPNNKYFVLDTYLLNLKIWSHFKYGECHPWIEEQVYKFRPELTFLLKPNIPWVEDPLRETPDDREEIFKIFEKEIRKLNWPFYIVDEVLEKRANQAENYMKSFLQSLEI